MCVIRHSRPLSSGLPYLIQSKHKPSNACRAICTLALTLVPMSRLHESHFDECFLWFGNEQLAKATPSSCKVLLRTAGVSGHMLIPFSALRYSAIVVALHSEKSVGACENSSVNNEALVGKPTCKGLHSCFWSNDSRYSCKSALPSCCLSLNMASIVSGLPS
jgi:hypothetical protein